jgi:primosomal protein N' (replication factor Y)
MRGPDLKATEEFAESMTGRLEAVRAQLQLDCRILGPAPPPLARLRGKYRFHVIIQSVHPEYRHRLLQRALVDIKPPKEVQYVVDIDPMDTL